tara:strand:+ start:3885 stop:5135 length:1251 start_codon:yes stop_codon:yes gene_type:complete
MADKDYTFTIVTEDKSSSGRGSDRDLGKGESKHAYASGAESASRDNPKGTREALLEEREDAERIAGTMALFDRATTAGDAGDEVRVVGRSNSSGDDSDNEPSQGWVELLKDTGKTLVGGFTGAVGLLGSIIKSVPGPPDSGTMDPTGVSAVRGAGGFVSGTLKRAGNIAAAGSRLLGGDEEDSAEPVGVFSKSANIAAGALSSLGEGFSFLEGVVDSATSALSSWTSWIDAASEEVQAFSPELLGERVETSLSLLFKKIQRGSEAGDEMAMIEVAKRDMLLAFEDFKTTIIGAFGPLLRAMLEGMTWVLKQLPGWIELFVNILGHVVKLLGLILDWILWLIDWLTWGDTYPEGLRPFLKNLGDDMINMNIAAREREDKEPEWALFNNWLNNPQAGLRALLGPDAGAAPLGVNVFAD